MVTRVPKTRGEPIAAGQVVVEVSGRPLIVLPGSAPAYRDLREGQHGPDVTQLQQALRSLRLYSTKISGTFDAATRAAVLRLYGALGYDAPTTAAMNGATASVTLLPRSEVMFLPAFPARVTAIGASVGDTVSDAPLITVSSGALAVEGRLNPSEAGLIRAGKPLHITSEFLGQTADGTVSEVGDVASDNTTGEHYIPVTVATTEPLDARFEDQEVRLTIESASSISAVLVVPLAAVYSGADGATYVGMLDSGAHESRVSVTVGITALGASTDPQGHRRGRPHRGQLTSGLLGSGGKTHRTRRWGLRGERRRVAFGGFGDARLHRRGLGRPAPGGQDTHQGAGSQEPTQHAHQTTPALVTVPHSVSSTPPPWVQDRHHLPGEGQPAAYLTPQLPTPGWSRNEPA